MVIGTDYQKTYSGDHFNAIAKTVKIILKNEIELGEMIVTGGQSVRALFLSVALVITSLEDSSLRDGVDWLVSKLCSGEFYYHFIANITGFRLV